MAAKNHRELVVWQLADELRREVLALTANPPASRDFAFRDQLRDAMSSIPANLAEGFRRSSASDFARFVTYAFSGLAEVEDRIDDGLVRGYWKSEDLRNTRRLIRRLTPGLLSLLRYLRTPLARARSQALQREPKPEPAEPVERD